MKPISSEPSEGWQDARLGRSAGRDAGQELEIEPWQAARQDIEEQDCEGQEKDPDGREAGAVEQRAGQLPPGQGRFERGRRRRDRRCCRGCSGGHQ